MVTAYVNGRPVGVWAGAEQLIAGIGTAREIELRDDTGKVLGRVIPAAGATPGEPVVPWDPTITPEELDRRAAEPGFSIDEVRKRLGWA